MKSIGRGWYLGFEMYLGVSCTCGRCTCDPTNRPGLWELPLVFGAQKIRIDNMCEDKRLQ